ncbi:hypothetical protein KIN20_004657 [Parelaphostrongylus tenuis]|uniref:Uncharacterized protein n=1 Tax=Parelaphostrongylus tenuis TaxID=148309 RepID=A0AAD5MK43_PARTN|nr:hypothetical protein KIN20_004657 [Parelaphostrongylus tenuis]
MQLLCLCITISAAIADLWNLRILSALNGTDLPSPTTIAYVKTYNGIDSFLCLIAFVLAAYIMYNQFYSSTNAYMQLPSVKLLGIGTALVILGVIRFICYFCEFFNLTGQDRVRALFANYTLDEPAWICTQLSLGGGHHLVSHSVAL